LLALENINKEALTEYAKEAANFSTNYSLPQLEFAVNHYGQPDVAMFDFTSMYAAENASHVIQRNGHKLLTTLVGDSLLEVYIFFYQKILTALLLLIIFLAILANWFWLRSWFFEFNGYLLGYSALGLSRF